MGIIKSLNQTSDKAADFGEIYYRKTQGYYKLKAFQQLVIILSGISKVVITGGLFFLAFIFLVLSGTLALSEILDSTIYACLIIASGLIALAIISYLLRHKVDTFIIRKSSKNFFD